MNVLNVAVWGLGPHATKNILPAIAAAEGVRLHGVCSRSSAVVDEISAAYGCRSWGSPSAMLDDAAVDVVFLSTPTGLHAGQGAAVLEAGKHLWCEKPLGTSLAEVQSLILLSRERGVTLAEAFMYLYHPQHKYLTNAIESGQLGRVEAIACRFGIPPLERPSFRTDPLLGGSALLDVGSYVVSAVVSFFPDLSPTVDFARMVTASGALVDTAGQAVLRYPAGPSAMLEWATDRAYRSEIDLWGTMGSLSSERVFSKTADYVPRFRLLDRRGAEEASDGTPANHFVNMLGAFCELVADADLADREREAISRRHQILDAIRIQSHRLGG